ncbi:peptidase P60 [Fulvimarina endophytica]|uniref:Peptidase P60 n=2 Tax=Fulvimarina endophytica TaxID=2293836 RepID=A0A371X5R1_9HYPH|nr:NlpC/P60 family protein [Fulvimarina endophytica]RFC64549.1 peptidase P60 [Fulvimarina endophytica]
MPREIGWRAARIAGTWIGTPYRHQGGRKDVGCDCLGLVRGVWGELYGREAERPGAYDVDWAVRGEGELMLEAARRHLDERTGEAPLTGDVLLFRWRERLPASHCGILDAEGRLVHAYEGSAVVSSAIPEAWMRRLAGLFRFPDTP